MMSKRTTSAVWVRSIVDMLAAEGLDVAALLAAAGIDPAALDASGARVVTEQLSRLWDVAVARSGNPAIGLAQHDVVRPASFDVVGYAMMSCDDLRTAFERLIRYMLILSDSFTMTLAKERNDYRISFELYGGSRPAPRARIEYIIVTLLGFCRWISGRHVRPLAIELPYPAPADLAPYSVALRCPVSFDATTASLLFNQSDMTAPLPASNPKLAELHERYAGEYLRQFDHAQISQRTREVIIRRLPDGEPRRNEVAGELRTSERTLQRRLEEEGTSFLQLLDDTRRELAEQYLGRLHLSLGQAAYLLGFSDQTSPAGSACDARIRRPLGKRGRIAQRLSLCNLTISGLWILTQNRSEGRLALHCWRTGYARGTACVRAASETIVHALVTSAMGHKRTLPPHFRTFALPESRHSQRKSKYPLSANSRREQVQQKPLGANPTSAASCHFRGVCSEDVIGTATSIEELPKQAS
jgi:AraC-like DNA-binding protein